MTPTLGSKADLAIRFCSAVFDWINGKLVLGKGQFAQHLSGVLDEFSKFPGMTESINSELHTRGINISLHRAVTQVGPEIRLDHIEDFVEELNRLKKRIPHNPKIGEKRQGQGHRSEEKPCRVETTKT